jgi:hypothetical protein
MGSSEVFAPRPGSPGLSEGSQIGSSGDETSYIQFSDLRALIDRTSPFDDSEVRQYCLDRVRFRMEHMIRRLNMSMADIRTRWPDASPVELYVAFEMCQDSLDDLLASIESAAFRKKVRAAADRRLSGPMSADDISDEPPPPPVADDDEDDGNDDEDDADFICTMASEPVGLPRIRPKRAVPMTPSGIPCPGDVDPDSWAKWSEARRRSYVQAQEHPNAYYYRHLPPDEVQRNGAWTPEERRLFFKRMRELRGDSDSFGHDWGFFSLAIPGRVGYQCSNFYRLLVSNGEMTDSQYVRGDDGKLHHTSRMHEKSAKAEAKHASRSRPSPHAKRAIDRPRNMMPAPLTIESIQRIIFVQGLDTLVEEYDEQEDEMVGDAALSRYERWAIQNPIPCAIDFLTKETIKVPAISPDGYILDYKTWLWSLSQRPVDPFTQNHLTKRQLVVLTTENYDQYADKILNLTTE